MDDVACVKCMWTGDSYAEVIDYCPVCDSETEYTEDEFSPYQDDFNWNKK